uniref:Cytochrome c oxidase subunit 2 n=1 Tax=Platerodrilus sp. MNCN/DNA:86739 TaxID=1905348 RepID=A0A342Z5E3_9COLE|nr:cytochrome c oxidase subunit II [Platerodrilus sp. MNCN/DNA:86739]
MATWSNWFPMEAKSPSMEQLVFFYDYSMTILTVILMMVASMMSMMMMSKFKYKKLIEEQKMETMWTITPTASLIFVSIPSLNLMYLFDEINHPSMSIKTIGNQWYWTYEYSDFFKKELNSYMETNHKKSNFRLLDVDNQLTLPFKSKIRMMFTSSDVIHSWTMQSLSTKMDATPGRLNQMMFFINYPSINFGQCSEICGMNHSFMPTSIESVSTKFFIKWMKN